VTTDPGRTTTAAPDTPDESDDPPPSSSAFDGIWGAGLALPRRVLTSWAMLASDPTR
jgi:hypothetical protein